MNLYVIRHGETDWNRKGILLSLEDISLNKKGIEQANEAKEIVENLDYDIVISSPLKRTFQTAKIINEKKAKEIVFEERIIERNAGKLSGKNITEEIFKDYWNVEKNIKYEGAETIKEFLKRVFSFLEEIKVKYSNKNILLVTHKGVCRAIKVYFEGLTENQNIKDYGQDNCEIKIYKI